MARTEFAAVGGMRAIVLPVIRLEARARGFILRFGYRVSVPPERV
jgi:hypothetical protein